MHCFFLFFFPPQGWDNENDNPDALQPAMLISLKAPKLCARHFHGTHHYLGGRYIPRTLELRYELNLPKFEGTDCIVQLKTQQQSSSTTNTISANS